MRFGAGAMLACIALTGACGPGETLSLGDCTEAFQRVSAPSAPPLAESVRPVAVGATLPILRANRTHDEPEDLMHRAFAGACLLDRDTSPTTGLGEWAEMATQGGEVPFLLSETIQVEYDGSAGRVRIDTVDEAVATSAVDAVHWDLAETAARDMLSELAQQGVISAMPYVLLFVTRGAEEGYCSEETPECRAEVDAHRFVFAPVHAGVPVPAAPVEIVVGSNGKPMSLLVSPRDFHSDGLTATAEVSEEGAEERLGELVALAHPGAEIFWEEDGELEFAMPVSESVAEMEPVLYARFIVDNGRPVEVSLPLSDADAPLE